LNARVSYNSVQLFLSEINYSVLGVLYSLLTCLAYMTV